MSRALQLALVEQHAILRRLRAVEWGIAGWMERKREPHVPNRPQSDERATPRRSTELKRWAAADLLGDASEAIIEHGTELYRLRLTSNNKLILTK